MPAPLRRAVVLGHKPSGTAGANDMPGLGLAVSHESPHTGECQDARDSWHCQGHQLRRSGGSQVFVVSDPVGRRHGSVAVDIGRQRFASSGRLRGVGPWRPRQRRPRRYARCYGSPEPDRRGHDHRQGDGCERNRCSARERYPCGRPRPARERKPRDGPRRARYRGDDGRWDGYPRHRCSTRGGGSCMSGGGSGRPFGTSTATPSATATLVPKVRRAARGSGANRGTGVSVGGSSGRSSGWACRRCLVGLRLDQSSASSAWSAASSSVGLPSVGFVGWLSSVGFGSSVDLLAVRILARSWSSATHGRRSLSVDCWVVGLPRRRRPRSRGRPMRARRRHHQ